MSVSEREVIEAIRPVQDPELGYSIVDLGLIYGVEVSEEGRRVEVRMTLTSPGCPVGPQLIAAAREAAGALPGVEEVNMELVWSPPWDPMKHCSEKVREELQDLLGLW